MMSDLEAIVRGVALKNKIKLINSPKIHPFKLYNFLIFSIFTEIGDITAVILEHTLLLLAPGSC